MIHALLVSHASTRAARVAPDGPDDAEFLAQLILRKKTQYYSRDTA